MTFLAPEQLSTERLLLRQFKESDWKALHKYYSSELATTFTMGKALTEGESWRAMCSMIGHWQVRGFGPYALEDKESGDVIGTAGIWYPNDWPEPEIKWALAPEYWGQGFASEAARAVQKMTAECFNGRPLISFIHSENDASITLAKAVGATFEQEVMFRGAMWHIYRHPEAKQPR